MISIGSEDVILVKKNECRYMHNIEMVCFGHNVIKVLANEA